MVRESRFLSSRWRLAAVVLAIGVFRLLGGIYLYFRMASLGVLESPGGQQYSFDGNFIYVFGRNWDALELQDVAANWYLSLRQFAWLPAFPSIIRFLSLGSGNYMGAAAISSSAFGLAWIPIFQLVCEDYMSRDRALFTTLLFALFPYVFLFTTVAYSESLFLFAAVASWYFYRRGKVLASSGMIAVATLTRVFGMFLIVPIAAGIVKEKKWRSLGYLLIPPLSLVVWMVYSYFKVGDLLAFRTAQGWPYFYQSSWMQEEVLPFLKGVDFGVYYLYPAMVLFLVFIALQTWNLDWRLGLYSLSQAFATLAFAGIPSYPRYFSFIFPFGMLLGTRSRVVIAVGVVFFAVVSLILWYTFLAYRWVA